MTNKPFKKRSAIAKGFMTKPPKVFKKSGTIADILRLFKDEMKPFKRMNNGGAVMPGRGGKFKGIS
tara:strand:- start:66 stop:263 length:198 start_codon:yes stop_codon:yes gene_type:complete